MPSIPTFNGLALFGTAITVAPIPSPNARSYYSVPGLNGVFSKNQGSRGGRTQVSGLLVAPTPGDLFLLEQAVRYQMASGFVSVFTDLNGVAWPYTVIESFQPADPVTLAYTIDGTGWGQGYQCVLFHHI